MVTVTSYAVAHPLRSGQENEMAGQGGEHPTPRAVRCGAQTRRASYKSEYRIVLESLSSEKQAPGRPNLTGRGKHLQKA